MDQEFLNQIQFLEGMKQGVIWCVQRQQARLEAEIAAARERDNANAGTQADATPATGA